MLIFCFVLGFDNPDSWKSSDEFTLELVLVAPPPSSTQTCHHALDQRYRALDLPAGRGRRAERQEAEEDGTEDEEKHAMM